MTVDPGFMPLAEALGIEGDCEPNLMPIFPFPISTCKVSQASQNATKCLTAAKKFAKESTQGKFEERRNLSSSRKLWRPTGHKIYMISRHE